MRQAESVRIDRIPNSPRTRPVTDELARVIDIVTSACPPGSKVSFAFDGHLHLFVDVRSIEDVVAVELILPGLGGGLFHGVRRSQVPRHGFGHRVAALVDR